MINKKYKLQLINKKDGIEEEYLSSKEFKKYSIAMAYMWKKQKTEFPDKELFGRLVEIDSMKKQTREVFSEDGEGFNLFGIRHQYEQ